MKVINREQYCLLKKDLGIDWLVNYLSVDVMDGDVWAYEYEPLEHTTSGFFISPAGKSVKIEMAWPFCDATIVRVSK